jgi:hypothetical protein
MIKILLNWEQKIFHLHQVTKKKVKKDRGEKGEENNRLDQ